MILTKDPETQHEPLIFYQKFPAPMNLFVFSPVILWNGGLGDLLVALNGQMVHARGKILMVGGEIDGTPGIHDIDHRLQQGGVIPVNVKMIPLTSPCKKRGWIHHAKIKALPGIGGFF